MIRLALYPIAFVVAVLLAEVLGAILQVQGTIMQQFAPLGLEVPLDKQLSWMWHDIKGLLPAYGPLLAIGFLIAFIAAAFVARLAPRLRGLVFTVAGAVAVLAIFLLAKPVFFGVTPIYGARDMIPMALQVLAGAAAGLVFAVITGKRA
jgi:hypothetical protein